MKTTHRMRASTGWMLAGAAALALALGMGATGSFASQATGRVTHVEGNVEIGRGQPPAWQPARSGDALGAGEAVRTGPGGRAELELGTGTVRLYENSLVRMPADAFSAAGAEAVELERGQSIFDVVRERLRRPFEVRTPEVVVSVKGTRFGVSLDGELAAVSVYRGLVGVLGAGSGLDEMLVRPGFAAVGGGSQLELMLLPGGDPWSAWSQGATALDAVPRALLDSRARPSLEEARQAAREAVKRHLVQHAEVKPEIVQQALRARRARAARTPTGDPNAPPASLDEGARESLREKLLDDRDNRPIERIVTGRVADEALTTPPPNGGGGGLPFHMNVVTSGGPNHVDFYTPGGALVHKMFDDDIEDVLDEGELSAYGPILNMLQQMKIDPVLFAEQLDDLL